MIKDDMLLKCVVLAQKGFKDLYNDWSMPVKVLNISETYVHLSIKPEYILEFCKAAGEFKLEGDPQKREEYFVWYVDGVKFIAFNQNQDKEFTNV